MNVYLNQNEILLNDNKLSLLSKICFASAGLPQQLTNTAFAVFSTKYMLDVARLPAHFTSIILLTSLVSGGLASPVFAYFVNRSKITKYGKMKPWILALAPVCCLSYVFVWYVPYGFDVRQLFFWLLFFTCIYQISLSGFRLPHTSMTMYLSDCERERDSATMIRMYFEIVSLLIAIIAQNLVIGDSSSECEVPSSRNDNLTLMIIKNESIVHHESHKLHQMIIQSNMNLQSRYLLIAIVFSSTFIISQILLAFGIKERTDLIVEVDRSFSKSFLNSRTLYHLKCMISFRPFIIFNLFTVFGNVAVLIVQGYMQLYFEYSFSKAKSYFGLSILIVLTLSLILLPVCKLMMSKYGEKRTYIVGNLMIVPFLIGSIFCHESYDYYLFISLAIVSSFAYTVNLTLPYTMLPKCIDAFYIKYKQQPDAIFYTFVYFNNKCFLAIYQAFAQFSLYMYGYQVNVCAEYQPKNIGFVIRMIFAPIPILFFILSSIVLLFYSLDVIEESISNKIGESQTCEQDKFLASS